MVRPGGVVVLVHCPGYALALGVEGGGNDDDEDGYDECWCKMMVLMITFFFINID